MAKRTRQDRKPRWFDEGDFTGWHDRITNLLACEPHKVAKILADELFGYEVHDVHFEDLQLEPPLTGYPTVFPDAIGAVCATPNDKKKQVLYQQNVVLEFKEHIDSLGAVMRQINIYLDRLNKREQGEYQAYLITPDLRYEEAFEAQQIYVLSDSALLGGLTPTEVSRLKQTVDSDDKVLDEFRYGVNSGVPEWLIGKTAREAAILTQQMYNQLLALEGDTLGPAS